MRKEPAVTMIPGPMVPNQGPSKKDMGALPEKTKRHSVPARKEAKVAMSGVKNSGPSKSDMGAIPEKTKSHSVPSHSEVSGGMQAGGMMDAIMKSGEQHQSPASKEPTKWHKRGYSMELPTADPEN